MRILSAQALAALQSRSVPLAILVEMDLSAPLYLNTSPVNLVINGATYYGTRGMGRINAIAESPSEMKQLQFELSGAPSSMVALALAEPVQGKAVRIKTAIFDPSTYQIVDAQLRWGGQLDVMSIIDQPPSCTLQVSAEAAGIDFSRPGNSPYTSDEQQRLYPGDLALQFLADQVEQRIIWPSAEFFKT
jgi:hypothetical protein